MKKNILSVIILLILLTGCGKQEKIICKNNQSSNQIEINKNFNIQLKNNNFLTMNVTIETILPENLLSQKETFIESFEKQYKEFEEKYGVQPVISETDEGVKIEMNMTSEQTKKIYKTNGTKVTKQEIIENFKSQGFTCEEQNQNKF